MPSLVSLCACHLCRTPQMIRSGMTKLKHQLKHTSQQALKAEDSERSEIPQH